MRRLLILGGLWLANLYSCSTWPAHASAIKGRVVDSAGQPVAGAQIRIWRKTGPVGPVRNQPVLFGNEETLKADDAGRFATPDLFDNTTSVRLLAQAEGLMAGRSPWLMPQGKVVEIEDIVLVRLHSIIGQVIDDHGTAVADATVFNCDGHERVETKTGRNGKFLLEGAPTDSLFLFAEKPGYRLTGVLLRGQKSVELRLVRTSEPTEPLRTHEPVLTSAERAALVHRALDPYLQTLPGNGTRGERVGALEQLAKSDPMAAIEALDHVGFTTWQEKESATYNIVRDWMQGSRGGEWDKIFAWIESFDNHDWAASWLVYGVNYSLPMPITERRRTRQWLDEAVVRARAGARPMTRVVYLALAAEGYWRLEDRERTIALAREAERAAKELSPEERASDYVVTNLARAFALFDLAGALARLDQVKDNRQFTSTGTSIVLNLARTDAAKAEEAWNHLSVRRTTRRDESAADVCFRLAKIDPEAARRVAETVKDNRLRATAHAAVARALGGDAAMESLRKLTADPGVRRVFPDSYPWRNGATLLMWYVPLVEEVDQMAARDLFWEALTLRPLRPTTAFLDDEVREADTALAQAIARFEPAISRALLEPAVRLLPELASFGPTNTVVAAAYVDPRWAVELLERLPEPTSSSMTEKKNHARLRLAQTLGLNRHDYWEQAGFWEPEE